MCRFNPGLLPPHVSLSRAKTNRRCEAWQHPAGGVLDYLYREVSDVLAIPAHALSPAASGEPAGRVPSAVRSGLLAVDEGSAGPTAGKVGSSARFAPHDVAAGN